MGGMAPVKYTFIMRHEPKYGGFDFYATSMQSLVFWRDVLRPPWPHTKTVVPLIPNNLRGEK